MLLQKKEIDKLDKKKVNRYWKPNPYYEQLQNKIPIKTKIPIPKPTDYINSRKIRIYPSTEQKNLFNKFLGANRHFFNKTNHYIKEEVDDKKRYNHYYMRQKMFEDQQHWYNEIPYDNKSLAIKQCITAYKSAFENQKQGHIDHFDIGFLSKKQTTQVCYLRKNAYNFNKNYIFPRTLNKHKKLRIKEFLKETTCSDLVLLKIKPGIWYLCIPYKDNTSTHSPSIYKNVFIDPGIRTFLTCYNPENNTYKKLGNHFTDELLPLGKRVDKLISVRTDAKGRTKYNLSKRICKLRYHIKNKTTNLHWQTCNYLTTNYQNIFLPHLDTIEISDHIKSNISNETVRKMMMLSHGYFRTKLEHAVKIKQRSLFYIPEAYTTKTCPKCGHENDIGALKVHTCIACDYRGDRDNTGALNICISTLLRTN